MVSNTIPGDATGRPPGSRQPFGSRPRCPRLPGRLAFPAVIVIFLAIVSQTAVPSPFYPRYSQQFGLSALELTIVFAAYVAGQIATLLTVGSLSDYVGRRSVLAASGVVGVAAVAMFLTAGGFADLVIGRVLEGFSIGTGNAALAAVLIDLAPQGNVRLSSVLSGALPPTALCIGSLIGGIALDTSSAPVPVAYGISLAAIVVGLVLTAFLPETRPRRDGALASLRPRIGVPPSARRAFTAVAGALVSGWALAGLYLGLVPSALAAAWPHADALLQVLPLAEFLACAGLAGVILTRVAERRAMYVALGFLISGTAIVGVALMVPGVPAGILAPGTALAGLGFGGTFQSSLRYLVRVIGAHERATVMAAALTLAFAAFGLPSIAAGAATPALGILPVSLIYAIAVFAVGAATIVVFRLTPGSAEPAVTPEPGAGIVSGASGAPEAPEQPGGRPGGAATARMTPPPSAATAAGAAPPGRPGAALGVTGESHH
ncbi:MAG TPA: MFS transporter [Trebonia sp.]